MQHENVSDVVNTNIQDYIFKIPCFHLQMHYIQPYTRTGVPDLTSVELGLVLSSLGSAQ